jgi:hypothetical protein
MEIGIPRIWDNFASLFATPYEKLGVHVTAWPPATVGTMVTFLKSDLLFLTSHSFRVILLVSGDMSAVLSRVVHP